MDYEKERTIKGAGLSEKGQVLSVTFQVNHVCILMLNKEFLTQLFILISKDFYIDFISFFRMFLIKNLQ